MEEIKGNLVDLFLQGEFDVIAHQANCFHTFGSGIAKEIKQKIPGAYEADLQTSYGDINKLGTYSNSLSHRNSNLHAGLVYNIYSQFSTSRLTLQTNYLALELALYKINSKHSYMHIGLPLIGCGLAGGDWNIVKAIIQRTLVDMKVTIVRL